MEKLTTGRNEGGPRRIVVGRDPSGRSDVVSDSGVPPALETPNVIVSELWKVAGLPADQTAADDRCGDTFSLEPPAQGVTFRHVTLPPDEEWKTGDEATDPDPFHQTGTVDFVAILKGEVWCVTEGREVLLGAGDSLVQLGGNHAWSVRGAEPCEMIAILLDAAN